MSDQTTITSTSNILKGWAPLTTRLLEQGGSSAWNVIDGAVGEHVCTGVQQELVQSKVFDKLMPSRTKGEVEINQLMTLLMVQGAASPSSPSSSLPPMTMIRGDKSIFLSRETRSNTRFRERHPNLHRLIEVVQNTVVTHLSSTTTGMHLNTAQTSVQLAVYPGDGTSGYVRHCDRGQGNCQHENCGDVADDDGDNPVGRLITAIYYLTDHDWSATDDGGALRVFSSSQTNQSNDIVPYRDRLVVFRSDGVEHQVLPSLRRSRTAITMWFYGRLLPSSVTTTSPPKEETIKAVTSEEPTIIESSGSFSSSLLGPPPLPVSPVQTDGSDSTTTTTTTTTTMTTTTVTIFVGISSYRDSEIVPTLRSLFTQAQRPSRISVGLVLQLDDNDDNDKNIWRQIQEITKAYPDQVRCLRMSAKDASGPCYARALCQSLHRGEDYFLQIDSHMRVRKNWDTYLVDVHSQVVTKKKNHRVILTTYPVGYNLPNKIPIETRGTVLVPWKFDESGFLRQRGRLMLPRSDPVPCYLIAAGFFFGPARMIQEVPYDPTLHQLFFGEELSMAVRFFTHGYDCLAPPETVCYHLWSRAHRPTQQPMSSREKKQREMSWNIVRQQLMGVNESSSFQSQPHYYGLGTLRSVPDFAKALGVDFASRMFLKDGVENGTLSSQEFVPDQSPELYPQDSLEHKVATLDLNTRRMISRFLPGGLPMG